MSDYRQQQENEEAELWELTQMDELNLKKLEKLREKFDKSHVGKLPKPTKQQTDLVKQDYKNGRRCDVCGGWHHPQVIHLDYVGHASVTNRLLDVDPVWAWEPLAVNEFGLPAFDQNGGLWIKLTVLGVTRIGYGHASDKKGGDAVKEAIGDAIRNAAMRFGVALELWHKGEFQQDENGFNDESKQQKPEPKTYTDEEFNTKFADWQDMVLTKGKTAKNILNALKGRGYVLTPEQYTKINRLDEFVKKGNEYGQRS